MNSWKYTNLDEALELVIDHRGLTPKKLGSDWTDEGIAAISAMNVKRGKIVSKNQIRYVTDGLYRKWMPNELMNGDVLLTSEAPLGEAYIIRNNEKFCLSQRLFALRPKNTVLVSEYLYYYLTSEFGSKKLHERATGSTAKGIRQTELLKVEIPVPPISTQNRISTILYAIDQDIEKTDCIIQKTEVLKKGLLFDQFLKGKNSTEWKYQKLNKITHKITDGTHRTPKYLENGIPFLRINDIHNSEIDWNNTKHISPEEHEELIKRCYPEKGDILLSKNGTIGITKVVNWDKPFSIFVSLCLIKPNTDIVMSDYLGLVVGSDFVLDQAKQRSKQGTVTNLHLEEIRDFDIPVPSKDIQRKIIDIASVVDLKLKNERTRYSNLVNLKQGLLNDIFSRKVEVN